MSAVMDFFQQNLPGEWAVFLISMLPIVELRGAIPFGIGVLELPWYSTFALSVIGNMLPIPIVMWIIRPLLDFLKKLKIFRGLVDWMEAKIKKNSKKVLKYSKWGLFLFVAIPIPGTGAWTGAMVADFLDIRIRDALPTILGGVIVAGIIMTVASAGIVSGLEWLL